MLAARTVRFAPIGEYMPDTVPSLARFTHLISDCDGVLIDSEAVALQALLELLGPRLPNLPQGVTLQGLIEPRRGQRLVPLGGAATAQRSRVGGCRHRRSNARSAE